MMTEPNRAVQNSSQPPHCRLADASIFLGITTMPMHEQLKFIEGMRRFFGDYKRDVASPLNDRDKAKFAPFYVPMPYVLMGTFDLALLALMEDFEFGSQTFNPFDPRWPEKKSRPPVLDDAARKTLNEEPLVPFAHRVILGPCPCWESSQEIIDLAGETFLPPSNGGIADAPQQPLLGICQVEVNTSLLVGGGANFLRALVKAIRSEYCDYVSNKNDKTTKIIILESYSWHELTLLVFSDSFMKIIEFLARVRRMRLIDLAIALCRERIDPNTGGKKSYRDEWQELLKLGNLYGLLKTEPGTPPARLEEWFDWFSLSPAVKGVRPQPPCREQVAYLKNPSPADEARTRDALSIPPFGTHVLFNTTTTLGYWAGFLEAALKRGDRKVSLALDDVCRKYKELAIFQEERKLAFVRRWNVKAGHEFCVMAKLQDLGKFVVSPGRADMVGPCKLDGGHLQFEWLNSRQIVEKMVTGYVVLRPATASASRSQCGPDGEPCAGALSVNSCVALVRDGDPEIPTGHLSADELRVKLACHYDVIEQVFRDLKKMRVSKVVTERVLNAIALYNDGILDNFLFSSLLELRPYLKRIVRYIHSLPPDDPAIVNETLNGLATLFEMGWRNRFHGGWRLGELADFNLEFKGGVQQLLSAFQAAHRLMSWGFALDDRTLAVITGETGISVHLGALRLSFFDVFKPSFFASRVGHETAEQILERSESDVKLSSEQWEAITRVREYSYVHSYPRGRLRTIDSVLRDALAKLVNVGVGNTEAQGEVVEAHRKLEAFGKAFDGLRRALNVETDFVSWWGSLDEMGQRQVAAQARNGLQQLIDDQLVHQDQFVFQFCYNRMRDLAQSRSLTEMGSVLADLLGWMRAQSKGQAGDVNLNQVNAIPSPVGKLLDDTKEIVRSIEALQKASRDAKASLTDLKNRLGTFVLGVLRSRRSFFWFRRAMHIAIEKEPLLSPLLDVKEPRFFDQVFADICNFVIVYGKDAELYIYRSLGSFVVEPGHWDSRHQIKPLALWEGLLRLFLTLGAAVTDEFSWNHIEKAVETRWKEAVERTPDVQSFLRTVLKTTSTDIIKLAREVAERMHKLTFDRWCRSAVELASVPLGFQKCWDTRFRFERFLREKHPDAAVAEPPRSDDVAAWVQKDLGIAAKRYEEACKLLKEGKGYIAGRHRPLLEEFATKKNNGVYPHELDMWFDFCDVVVLLRAYLRLLLDRPGLEAGKNCILQRNEAGRPDIRLQDASSMFDPRGGTFTIDADYRRVSFMVRSALAMSLFDLSEKGKLLYCLQRPELLKSQAQP